LISTCRRESAEVLYSDSGIEDVTKADIEELKGLAAANPRKRVRLCAHHQPSDKLHEMLIVHERSAYVRPHKHPGKTESTHIVEGEVDVVVFDDDGGVVRVIECGEYSTGRTFFYRMGEPAFHTLVIRSKVLVFHETTDGPFNRADTVFAPWAPADGDASGVEKFLRRLQETLRTKQSETR
jgi:cupin fold WbuC family metalloprotein